MKNTFEKMLKENIKAFVKSFKKKPNKAELEAIRHITHAQAALIGLAVLQADTNKFINYYQNV